MHIAIVHPYLAFEVTLAGFQFLRLHRENESADLVDLLASQITYVVFRQLIGCQHEGLNVAQILYVASVQTECLERAHGSPHHFLLALARRRENYVAHLFPLASYRATLVERHHARTLAISIVAPRLGELGFLGRELVDDFFNLGGVGIGSAAGKRSARKQSKRRNETHKSSSTGRDAQAPGFSKFQYQFTRYNPTLLTPRIHPLGCRVADDGCVTLSTNG